jgi:hypothetical protein
MLKKNVIGLSLVALTSVASAAPPVLPPTPLPVGNDGFIYVAIADQASNELLPRFCPAHARYSSRILNPSTCVDRDENAVQPVTAQTVLDQTFGAGKAIAVGLAPSTDSYSIVYYKIRKDNDK